MSSGRNWVVEYTSGTAAGKDFTTSDVAGLPAAIPNWFELTAVGTITFVDGDGTSRTLSSVPANQRYNVSIRSITSSTAGIRLGYSEHPQPSTGVAGPTGPAYSVTGVKTGAYTAAADELVPVNTSGGAVTITLPTAVGIAGKRITIKDTGSAGTNAITVAVTGGQTVDGAAPATIAVNKAARTYVSDGANWYTV